MKKSIGNLRDAGIGRRARDAAREQRAILRRQAMAGVSRALAEVGLDDPDDLSAATVVWEHIVSALVQWWQQHPDQTAADMTAHARRVLTAASGRQGPPDLGVSSTRCVVSRNNRAYRAGVGYEP